MFNPLRRVRKQDRERASTQGYSSEAKQAAREAERRKQQRRDEARRVPVWRKAAGGAAALALAALGFLGGGAAGAVVTAADRAQQAPITKTHALVSDTPNNPASADGYRTCSIEALSHKAEALEFHGYAVDTATGQVLVDDRGEQANAPASVMKLLTASAALATLGPDHRIPTRVYQGADPSEVVLVGGGDPTLSSLAPGIPSYYSGATAFLSDLAEQVKTARSKDPALKDVKISRILIDDSLFDGDWNENWHQDDRTNGYISPVTALQVNGDRKDPKVKHSPRSEKPSIAAGEAFAERLGVPVTEVKDGKPPEGATQLGEVLSEPVSALVGYMLRDSDNTLAESLARLTAIKRGTGNTFTAIHPAIKQSLKDLGLDVEDMTITDGSGLSGNTRLRPRLVVELLQVITSGIGHQQPILDALPANGGAGTLDKRMTNLPIGSIRAKTGTLNQVLGLAGYLHGDQGTEITFAYFVVGDPTSKTNQDALDAITAATYNCGEDLAGW
ncbi:D-alanyl-D-alanine carboxypeptidase/D-alanyl-D-alanine-endopeptidase [Pseudoclavibacter albus]|uniref:D-alanyl-D-alanine carboxypeptidase/D-alanyl-D-alanine-endopeptidase n=1 Tax=Pseudoclavibacter albus TaxID=272241 RepID=UPI0008250CFA|nr:D-alanyl-D-alanine carboxypeptidase [Pseudoclavibacter alba]